MESTTQALLKTVLPDCETLDQMLCSTPQDTLKQVETKDDESSPMAPITDLKDPERHLWIVTTAALPWRTGTSVNPLARALYLTRGRTPGKVTLVIPFLSNPQEQAKVYGKDLSFESPEQQETWIRDYCKERIQCEDEATNLQFLFYQATYNPSFGSIFSTQDICSLIPSDKADVCILEEPEHINWMRVVDPPAGPSRQENDEKEENEDLTQLQIAELGWQAKFQYVVGILHTNYDAYARQYGFGAGLLAAGALHALSAHMAKAYTHRLIRLSDTLPSLVASKEITCNVHGVRSEFFGEDDNTPKTSEESKEEQTEEEQPLSDIYFIGKLIWAKGFDKLLDIQELFKKETGQYFPIDIYGSGPDEMAIQRACFGRKGILTAEPKEAPSHSREATPDRNAKAIFNQTTSLREQLSTEQEHNPIEVVYDEAAAAAVSPRSANGEEADEKEAVSLPKSSSSGFLSDTDFPNPFVILSDLSGEFFGTTSNTTKAVSKIGSETVELGVTAMTTEGSSTGNTSASSSVTSQNEDSSEEEAGEDTKETKPEEKKTKKHRKKLRFDPIKSRYELRRYPAPARFMGMKDHALLVGDKKHKIFFNPSESEVLCTTSAEALAMGKFVVLPKHPSNTFFEQFENCLAYETKAECVAKLQYAMENDPKPLSDDEKFQLSWEGANQRLFESAAMTEAQWKDWEENYRASDREAAKIHYETVRRGRGVQKLLHRTGSSMYKN